MREKSSRIFSTNVRGLVCNWNNARSFNWKDYDIVVFNEIQGKEELENLSVDGFEAKAKKEDNSQEGVVLYFLGKKNW